MSHQQSEWLTPVPTARIVAPVSVLDGPRSVTHAGMPRTGLDIVIAAAPTAEDFQAIFRALDDFNAPVVGHARFEPLAVLIRGEAGEVTGGLWACSVYSWLVINMLFVPAALRRRGVGTVLIRAAETEAKSRGCIGMQVDTFGFQAQPFYERLGFTVFGVQPNFPPGQRCVFLRKPFDDI